MGSESEAQPFNDRFQDTFVRGFGLRVSDLRCAEENTSQTTSNPNS